MPHRLHRHPPAHEGFTLIELLVVILIIGILAAVAVPTFLTQTNKASDSNLQSALGTAHITEATYRTANGGYTNSSTALTTLEPSLTTPVTSYGITVAYWAPNNGTGTSLSGYSISGRNSKSGVTYTLNYDATTGAVQRACTPPGVGACSAAGTWGS